MTVNEPLVLATLDLIENNLDRWDQDTFVDFSASCGTTMCFGGWGLMQSGYTLVVSDFHDKSGSRVHPHDVENEARRVFGFTYTQANEIFYWFPCDHMDDYVTTGKREEFEAFKNHVLAVTGLTDES